MSNGDRVEVAASYLSRTRSLLFHVKQVEPAGAGLIGAGTRFVLEDRRGDVKAQASKPR